VTNLSALPSNLPTPQDDGACNHLIGKLLPDIFLASTQNTLVNLSVIKGWVVIYCYPMTGKPNVPLPNGWDEIPGARGCTPQSCAFRDNFVAFARLKTQVFGLSTQTTAYQQEAAMRLALPYLLLSDERLEFAHALNLPTFQVEITELIKRLTLIVHNGVIQHCFYPVFPPDKNAEEVINWLESHV
jgi:peroxiredoxin